MHNKIYMEIISLFFIWLRRKIYWHFEIDQILLIIKNDSKIFIKDFFYRNINIKFKVMKYGVLNFSPFSN